MFLYAILEFAKFATELLSLSYANGSCHAAWPKSPTINYISMLRLTLMGLKSICIFIKMRA